KRTSLDVEGNLQAYLYATLRNKVLNELRGIITFSKHLKTFQKLENTDSALPDDVLFAKETSKIIESIINAMPNQCREAFILSRFEYLSHKEIAERMSISVNTVEKHIGKALRLLRNELK